MELRINKNTFFFKEKWIIRFATLAIFILCLITLTNINVYRPFYVRIISGVVDSFFLNLPLIVCTVSAPTGGFRHLLAFGVFLSGLSGVFLVIPNGWPFAAISIIFHLWFIYKLVSDKGFK